MITFPRQGKQAPGEHIAAPVGSFPGPAHVSYGPIST